MFVRSAVFACALLAAASGFAQGFPTKPVTLVVGFAPGGASDIIARQVAAKLTGRLGQTVVVDNRAGAGGTIAAGAVARAAPDGYTLLFASASALSISPWLNKSLPYDSTKAFAPVAELVRGYYVLNGSPTLPIKTMKELAAWGASNPGKLSCGSAGPGTIHHLSCELLATSMNMPLTHVPFKGSAPAFNALMAGDIQIMFESMPTPVPMIQSGKVRGLAVTGPKRLDVLPDVPTLGEQGIRGVDVSFWFGVVAPAGTPQPVVDRLNAGINEVLKDPEVLEVFKKQGVEVAGGSSAAFASHIAAELKKWGDVVTKANIKPE
jgi:tripartite-type tricarboxylate transporter receptor subunit TctC